MPRRIAKKVSHVKPRKLIYCIGIGGIGVSALAQWYLAHGWDVSGSDTTHSVVTDQLKKRGAIVHIGRHRASWVPRDTKLLIYTAAIQADNPERQRATKLKIPQFAYAEALGEISKRYKTIAISGAHGKSTTTAMVSLMLIKAGLNPTVIIGTRMREFGNTNFHKGRSEWLVIEADEFHHSFLQYYPYAAITTNVDREHLDYYKNFSNIKKAFQKFFSHIDPSGFLVINREDPILKNLALVSHRRVLLYDTINSRAKQIRRVLRVPGKHNLSNAMACDTFGAALQIPASTRLKALAAFRGTWRRFEFRGMWHGARIYDDYAHHPTEIKATLAGAREQFPKKHIWCVFQPHHNARLRLLFTDFIKSFTVADRLTILETYKVEGRDTEERDKRRNAAALAHKIGDDFIRDRSGAVALLKRDVSRGDVIICMGAGDIGALATEILRS